MCLKIPQKMEGIPTGFERAKRAVSCGFDCPGVDVSFRFEGLAEGRSWRARSGPRLSFVQAQESVASR